MSEITREALEGMGFERGNDGVFVRSFGEFKLSIEEFGGFPVLYGVTTYLFLPQFCETLPQLRRLIRSLFGDDALPRRELSTITDEEFRQSMTLAGADIGDAKIKRMNGRLRAVWSDSGDNGVELSFSGGIYHYINGTAYDLSLKLARVLVDEFDFYLPAFHSVAQ